MNEGWKTSMRVWAFWAGVIGLLSTWGRLGPWIGDGIRNNVIELAVQIGGFAIIGAILAYIRNRIARPK
jgi:hypothetical protein